LIILYTPGGPRAAMGGKRALRRMPPACKVWGQSCRRSRPRLSRGCATTSTSEASIGRCAGKGTALSQSQRSVPDARPVGKEVRRRNATMAKSPRQGARNETAPSKCAPGIAGSGPGTAIVLTDDGIRQDLAPWTRFAQIVPEMRAWPRARTDSAAVARRRCGIEPHIMTECRIFIFTSRRKATSSLTIPSRQLWRRDRSAGFRLRMPWAA